MLTEKQARKRHEKGKLYTVLVGDPLKPSCFLEVTAYRAVIVDFLDESLRTYWNYAFQEKEPNRLFLSMFRRPEFPNEIDDPDRATVFYFKTSGRVTIVRYQGHADGIGSYIVGKEEQTVDLTANWEPYPEFGHYEGLARRDRDDNLFNYLKWKNG